MNNGDRIHKLERRAPQGSIDLPPALLCDGSPRPQLHYLLSTEHAAIAAGLSPKQLKFVRAMGYGWPVKQIAYHLHLRPATVHTYTERLKQATRMSRLQLCVLGYLLNMQYPRAA
jgi:DNA-binding NarL/FixJ family response regulator